MLFLVLSGCRSLESELRRPIRYVPDTYGPLLTKLDERLDLRQGMQADEQVIRLLLVPAFGRPSVCATMRCLPQVDILTVKLGRMTTRIQRGMASVDAGELIYQRQQLLSPALAADLRDLVRVLQHTTQQQTDPLPSVAGNDYLYVLEHAWGTEVGGQQGYYYIERADPDALHVALLNWKEIQLRYPEIDVERYKRTSLLFCEVLQWFSEVTGEENVHLFPSPQRNEGTQ